MPRMARLVLPNSPHHVVQRGHNKQVVFADTADFKRYLANLRELKTAFAVKVYAFCLMTNHVHLLLDPGEDPTALAKLMKALAARTTRYRNRLEGRSGTLWESRYRSSIVQSDTYLLACIRYIELNPVRAYMVEHPGNYPWSSFSVRFNTINGGDWLDEAPCFMEEHLDPHEKRARYVSLIEQGIPTSEIQLIRNALQRGQLTGNSVFTDDIEKITGLRIANRGQGRPAKAWADL
ncbi:MULTISPECIES: transposase [Pseudomonas]|jgi:putative transposase|uniref:Transposase n=1 Tax=Pseudomonas fluorescens LMG 5329 TaxID=1324332 RepID=A0A0A1YT34_PSEFL|nr:MULTISPECIES: transposase [Pseudomonas]KGE65080.1 transposase [Pseudomonas fluorescens LMG 5329]NWE05324.1 transposase [Pseudomonas sp. IPO3749]NWF20669.1 transposase [Pseudomonas sp. IPO3749]